MLYLAVCDDNEIDVCEIVGYLADLNSEGLTNEITPFRSGPDLIAAFDRGARYDLLILDMLMKPMDGMRTARAIRVCDASVPILIVTTTARFALEGYEVGACRYLLKPLAPNRFRDEVRLILSRSDETADGYFSMRRDSGLIRERLADIVYFESRLHTVTLHTMRKTVSFRGAIGIVEQQLCEHGFFRVHKSFIVNLIHVRRLSNRGVEMITGERLPVSRLRAQAFRAALLDVADQARSIAEARRDGTSRWGVGHGSGR